MSLNPVKERKLVLSKLSENFGLLIAGTELFFHLFNLCGNSGVTCMLVECFKKIKLRVLLDLNTEVVELLDGCVTSKEVERSGTEGNDLEILKTNDSASDRNEFVDHVCALCCCSYGILGDISLDVSELKVVACIKHTAICIATAVHKVCLALFCCRNKDRRSIEVLSKKCLGNLGSEVSKVNAKRVTSCLLDVLKSLNHVDLALYDTDGALIDISCAILISVSFNESFSSVNRKTLGETITAYCYNTDFNLR